MLTKTIAIDQIEIDEEFNSRDKIDMNSIIDMSKSIENQGLIQPIVVRELPDGTYRLLAGFRRTKAHLLLAQHDDKFKMIGAVIKNDLTSMQERVLNLNENLERKDLTILEEAKALRPLFAEGMSEADIVDHLPSASRGWVQIRTMVLKLPPDIQEEIGAGMLTQTNIRDLYTLQFKGAEDDTLYEEVRKIKDAKSRGSIHKINCKPVKVKSSAENKHMRSRTDIFVMIQHMLSNNFDGLATRVLSWAAGEISDLELFLDFENEDGSYNRPEVLDYKVKV